MQKYTRKQQQKQNGINKKKNQIDLNQAESILFGQIDDLQQVVAKNYIAHEKAIVQINRETNNFVDHDYKPQILKLTQENTVLKTQVDTLVDILLTIKGVKLSDEQMEVLGLEPEVKETEKAKEVKASA